MSDQTITFHSGYFDQFGRIAQAEEWTVLKSRIQAIFINDGYGEVYVEGVRFADNSGIRVNREDAIRIKDFIS